ncbi:hypothetical protein D7X25_16210 [bacterium 1XD42-8]|nr:hypothetical protein D7X25_16210 [bacterium 1XD42-8]
MYMWVFRRVGNSAKKEIINNNVKIIHGIIKLVNTLQKFWVKIISTSNPIMLLMSKFKRNLENLQSKF